MHRPSPRRSRWVLVAALLVVPFAPAAAADTPAGISLLYQSDAAYDAPTAQRLAQANPDDLLFRVMGPLTPNSMRVADITTFVGGLGNWSGRLWFSADATKSAFDQGYWGTTYGSSDAYKAYVDYLMTVNTALASGGRRTFDGIFLECEGSYVQKDASFIGRTGLLGQYLATSSTASMLIGTTGSYKQASSYASLGVDLLPIQAYNFDNGDPPGFATPSGSSASSLATAISGTLAGNYVSDPGSLTTPGVVVMLSYEPQFFGAVGPGSAVWDAPLFESFLGDFRTGLSGLGVSGSATIGIYDVGVALGAWDGTGLMVPEPNAWWLAAIGIACAAVGRSRRRRREAVAPGRRCLRRLLLAVQPLDEYRRPRFGQRHSRVSVAADNLQRDGGCGFAIGPDGSRPADSQFDPPVSNGIALGG